jgi:exodeoxyribonuclease VIII
MTRENILKRPLSFSSLKEFAESPKHYKHYRTKPKEAASPAMNIGSAVHCIVLEDRNKFIERYAVAPKCDKRTKEGKQIFADFEQSAIGKTVLSEQDAETVENIVSAIQNYEPAKKLIHSMTFAEKRFDTVIHSLNLCGYIDGGNDSAIFDIKTVQSANPKHFLRDSYNRLLHLQSGIYSHAENMEKDFYFIAAESVAPFNVTVFKCEPEFISKGVSLLGGLLEKFNFCLDLDLFDQGYEFWNTTNGIESLTLPKWA